MMILMQIWYAMINLNRFCWNDWIILLLFFVHSTRPRLAMTVLTFSWFTHPNIHMFVSFSPSSFELIFLWISFRFINVFLLLLPHLRCVQTLLIHCLQFVLKHHPIGLLALWQRTEEKNKLITSMGGWLKVFLIQINWRSFWIHFKLNKE